MRTTFPAAAWSAALLSTTLLGAPARAQDLTLYGLMDVAVERLDKVGATGATLNRMPNQTGSLPSRWGIRVSEDLGAGLKATVNLESGFGLDGGSLNQGGRMFGRLAHIGLAGHWGTVTLGRQYTMLFWSQLDADLLGPNVFGSASIDSYLPNARADNSIGYRGSFDGLTLGATYSLGRDAVNAGPSPGGTNCPGESADARACREWSAMLKYDAASWGVAAAVDELRGGSGAFGGLVRSDLSDRRATLTGWLKWRDLKVGAGVIARRNEGSAVPSSTLLYLGAAWSLLPRWQLEGQVFRWDAKGNDDRATLAALRASYFLSRRTTLYATVGRIDNDGRAAISVSNGAPGGGPAPGRAQSGVATGVRHTF